MFPYYATRICTALALLGLGLFCFRKMLTVQPHGLKKENYYAVALRSDLPETDSDEPLATFAASRGNLVGTAIFACMIVLAGGIGIYLRSPIWGVYLVPLTLVLFHTLGEGTKSVALHRHGVVVKSALGRKFHPYAKLDCLASYNVLNSFHKGVSYGYRFIKDGRSLVSMDVRQYPDVPRIEEFFAVHPEIAQEIRDPFDNTANRA